MNSTTLAKALSASFLCVALVGCAFKTSGGAFKVIAMGHDTYSITCEAKTAFDRDIDRLKDDATAAANNYCAAEGKQIKVISLTSDLPLPTTGYAKAKIVFKALNPGSPELEGAPAPAAAPGPAAAPVYAAPAAYAAPAPAVEPAKRLLTTDELYAELFKLDELRKKGILTDDEFQAEKRKLLNRSN